MRYYAKVFTGNPTVGMLTPGEYLTETQAKQYGEEKLKELCERGVLASVPEAGDAPKKAKAPAEAAGRKAEAEAAERKAEAEAAERKAEAEAAGRRAEAETAERKAEAEAAREAEEKPAAKAKAARTKKEESLAIETEEAEEAEMPEIGDADELISEAETPAQAKKTRKTGGRRK